MRRAHCAYLRKNSRMSHFSIRVLYHECGLYASGIRLSVPESLRRDGEQERTKDDTRYARLRLPLSTLST